MTSAKIRLAAVMYCAVLPAALVAAGASAATPPAPQLYGTYDVNGTVFCQPGKPIGAGGAYDVNVGQAKFNPNAGVVVLQQTQVYGSAKDNVIPFTVVTKNYDYTFSNTATTVTLNGLAYTVLYSNIQDGIAGTVSGVGVDSNGCARNFSMQLVPSSPPPPR